MNAQSAPTPTAEPTNRVSAPIAISPRRSQTWARERGGWDSGNGVFETAIGHIIPGAAAVGTRPSASLPASGAFVVRSEERRVGKEGRPGGAAMRVSEQ